MDIESAVTNEGAGGSSNSIALWQPERAVAQVLSQRGKLLMRMGFMQGGKLYLHIEEAVYLNLQNLLDLVIDTEKGRERLSAESAVSLLVSSGVGKDFYAVYAHLMDASLIVRRHPAQWLLLPEEDANCNWLLTGTPHGVQPETNMMECSSTSKVSNIELPPVSCIFEGRKNTVEHVSEGPSHSQLKQRSWWPRPVEGQAEPPRCQVDKASSFTLTPFGCAPCDFAGLEDAASRLALDVIPPNSKFSRKRPDPPIFHVCISQGRPPGREVMSAIEASVGQGIPVYFASVSGDDVSLYEFERVSLPSLL
ncbi:probable tRNA-splicing endonuclease subunit Sen54 at N-terminal half [Coccomyxa sp. Obi]|nr:probable tRNA-splicing endonuclease subunit Sen54 at N-terminal half [Coccomyxa sp. Obi]